MTLTIADAETTTTDTSQALAARVLLDLASHKGAPPVSWTLYSFAPDSIDGQISRDDPSQVAASVAQWADVFGIEVTVSTSHPDAEKPFVQHEMRTQIDGIRVRVWGLVYADAAKDAA